MSKHQILVVEHASSMPLVDGLLSPLRERFDVVISPRGDARDKGTVPRCIALLTARPERPDLRQLIVTLVSRMPDIPVVLVALAPVESRALMECFQAGIADYVCWPNVDDQLVARIDYQISRQSPQTRLAQAYCDRALIGNSDAFRAIVRMAQRIASSDGTVLITGETGTGKEVFARAIHYLGARTVMPFIPVNCGAIPTELAENELFGHEAAAFTGAQCSRHGLVAEAEGGSLFLDEVDSLSPSAQVKLLRLLQEKEYRPLGSTRTRRADIRVISATNTDIESAREAGRIRADLYYRLNVLPLHIPPLRDRQEDIIPLINHFLRKHNTAGRAPARTDACNVPSVTEDAIAMLLGYDWPGNVRELEHVIERAVLLRAREDVIDVGDLAIQGGPHPHSRQTLQDAKASVIAEFERGYIKRRLLESRGNISKAAAASGKNRRAFWELMRKYGIRAEMFRGS